MYSGRPSALQFSQQRKVSYLMDHSVSNLVSLPWIRRIQHARMLLMRGLITASDREIEGSAALIVLVYLHPQSNADEGLIYLLIMAGGGGGRINGWMEKKKSNFATQSPETSLNLGDVNRRGCGHKTRVIKCQAVIASLLLLCGGDSRHKYLNAWNR